MYMQRFKRCLAFSAVLEWIVLGFYPFGTPLQLIDDGLPPNPFMEVPQVFAFAFMQIVGLTGMLICVYVFGEFLFTGREKLNDLMPRRQAILSWAAPFALLLVAGLAVRETFDYMNGLTTGLRLAFELFVNMFFVCSTTMITFAALYHQPEHLCEE